MALPDAPDEIAPILASEKKLGDGKYQIIRFLGDRGRGRLYEANVLPEGQPCVIKEYFLPKKYFTAQEAKQRWDYLRQRAKVELADQKKMDFRLIFPIDVISNQTVNDELTPESCYLVTPGKLDACDTLRKYLGEKGAMNEKQVGHLLQQVLQTLNFLHTQKFRLPSGLILNGLAHGNLSLDSILIAPQEQEFLIYLCDLELWEGLFVWFLDSEAAKTEPSEIKIDLSSIPSLTDNLIKADLKQLGRVCIYLLSGEDPELASGQPHGAKDPEPLPTENSSQLQDFISGLIQGHFPSADYALQKLLDVLREPEEDREKPQTPESVKELEGKWTKLFPFLLVGSVLVLLLGLIVGIAKSRQKQILPSQFLPCCINQVPDMSSGYFSYTAEQNSTWDYILKQKKVIVNHDILTKQRDPKKQPKLKHLTYKSVDSSKKAIAKVRLAEADFAIAPLESSLRYELRAEKFAYDGLVVFVPFSYAQTKNSLPKKLKGKISLENLRKLYTDVDNKYKSWQDLDKNLPNIPIHLYIPTSEEAVRIFEQRVLTDKQAISAFKKLRPKAPPKKSELESCPNTDTISQKITQLDTIPMLRRVLEEFYDCNIGSIGFDTNIKVFGQCSVYPLALSTNNSKPVSPLIQDNKPITPEIDLCYDKGSYQPNIEAFISQSYPLAYPLVVIYPQDNRRQDPGKKFAYLLRTVEAQRLLKKVGLIPLKAAKSATD